MKPIRTTQSWNFNSLMLYRDELEEVLRIFNPTDAKEAIKILDDVNEYESLDELLKRKGERIDHIAIMSSRPQIGLVLRKSPRLLNLSTFASGDEADAAF